MVDFTTPSTKYNSERVYSPITTSTEIATVKTTFENDSSMSLNEKKVTGETYTFAKNILDQNGDVAGTIYCTSNVLEHAVKGIGGITNGWAVENIYDGYTAVADSDKTSFSMTLNGVTAAGDKVRLKVTEDKAQLIDYKIQATQEVLEEWADTVDALSGEVA